MSKAKLKYLVICLLFVLGMFQESSLASQAAATAKLAYVGSALWTKAHDIEIQGDLAYCAFMNGFGVLNISDIKQPVMVSQLYLGGGFALAVSGRTAFVASGDKGLNIIDVTDPKTPVLEATLDTEGEARDVALAGLYAFVADGPAGLLIVDIGNPSAPKIVGKWDSAGEALGIALRDNFAYIADGSAGLQIVDVKNPAKPLPAGALDTDGTSEAVALAGTHAFIADGASGIKVMDIGNPSAPRLIASLTASGYARSVSAEGKYLCAGSLYDGGFQMIDISNPAAPAVISTNRYTMYNEGWTVVLKENLAYVVDYFSGVFFMDISNPQRPRRAGMFFTPSSIVAAAVQGRYAYAVGELSGLQVLDIADPARPQSVGSTDIFRGVQGLAVSGNYAYVTDRWSVRIFDIGIIR